MRRLEIYSHCMDMICEEFPTFGTLLSEIKNEYDKIIKNIKVDQNEINFLKMKIQRLLAQNENRLLLKYETQRNKELESQLDELITENKSLSYYLNEKRDAFERFLLKENEELEGPEISGQNNEIKELKELQKRMVPKKEKEELEHILKSSEDILKNLKLENKEYELSLREQSVKVANLEKELKDKESKYLFLIKEYK
ncbi:hypothetical protein U3516DRAFT_821685 [Neocallimastix sp. 'constans']